MAPSIRCSQLAVRAEETELLSAVTFSADAPDLIALTGANGAGKTTLLKTLAGRQLPSSGECLINSAPPFEFDPDFRATVASLIDTPPLARDMTLAEQLALVSVSWGYDDADAFSAADEILEQLTIPELGERFPYELSAGQLQLFALALTLSRPFQILLLDEPERHLDTDRVEILLQLVESRVEDGALVIAATHREDIVNRAYERIHLERSPVSE